MEVNCTNIQYMKQFLNISYDGAVEVKCPLMKRWAKDTRMEERHSLAMSGHLQASVDLPPGVHRTGGFTGSYLTGDTLGLHYRVQPVNAM
jgi:hypothetical protein